MSISFLYIIKCSKYYKVGISSSPEARLSTFSTGTPFNMAIVHEIEFKKRESANLAEKVAHSRLSDYRVRMEWFHHDLEKIILICDEAAKFAINSCEKIRLDKRIKAKKLIEILGVKFISEISFISENKLEEMLLSDKIIYSDALVITTSIRNIT